MKKNVIRESNFELMRIISMFFIVLFHMFISTGGSIINYTTGHTKSIVELLCMIIIVHVNSFILVSGYFQYDKKSSMKKVLKLLLMAWFYKVVIAIIFYTICKEKFVFLSFLKIISPIEYPGSWFLTVYILLYILSPYINIIINKLNKKEYQKLLITLFVVCSIIPTITDQATFSSTGFTIVHFVYIYIVGAYLKKYPISKEESIKKISMKKKRIILVMTFLGIGIINFLMYKTAKSLLNNVNSNTIEYVANAIVKNLFYYQNPLLIIQSISYFLFFETLSFKNKFINKIASMIFAVYIIHENQFINKVLYKKIGVLTGKIFGFQIIIKAIVYSVIVMIVCIIIEFLRIKLFDLIKKLFPKKYFNIEKINFIKQ